ncbi:MAG: hypothetical protein R2741_06570 [Methanolobus sp.]
MGSFCCILPGNRHKWQEQIGVRRGTAKNPRKSIPVGTLAAIALSLVIYLLAYWLASSARRMIT